MENDYIPGVCNMGADEIFKRKIYFWTGMILSVVLSVCFYFLVITSILMYALLFSLVAFTAVNFFQIRNRFCVAMGIQGIFNFGKRGQHKRIVNPDFIYSDRRKSFSIIFVSLLIALIYSGACYFYIKTVAEKL